MPELNQQNNPNAAINHLFESLVLLDFGEENQHILKGFRCSVKAALPSTHPSVPVEGTASEYK